jgi:hypothetical protein
MELDGNFDKNIIKKIINNTYTEALLEEW